MSHVCAHSSAHLSPSRSLHCCERFGGLDAALLVSRRFGADNRARARIEPHGTAADVERAELMKKAAETATASMFPWERKQMDGSNKPLSRFDKFYWTAFGGAIVFLVGVNGRRWWLAKQKPEVRLHGSRPFWQCMPTDAQPEAGATCIARWTP